MEDKQLVVKNLDGEDLTINIFDIIKDTNNDKEYICYTLEDDENAYISSLIEENDSFSLGDVTDEEQAAIEQMINQNIEEGKYE